MKMISKVGAAILLSVVGASSAYAVPSFARQTGLSCDACHAGGNYVNLTQTGRLFKLNGYTMGGGHTKMPLPLAAMIQVQYSSTSTGANGVQSANGVNKNNQVMFPQMSIFYGGKIYGHVGAFIQVTYDSSDLPNGLTTTRIGSDNSDIRYANHTNFMGDNLIYGVSLNNAPTTQDVYASTPDWGYPWASSGVSDNAGIPGTQIGALAQGVVGLTAYAMYDNSIYLEAGGYQDGGSRNGILKNLTFNTGNDAGVNGTAPYARIAFQKYVGPSFFMIGGYGMKVNFSNSKTTKLDKYTDVAIDGEYQYMQGVNAITVGVRNTWENQKLNASYNGQSGTLSSFSGYGSYVYNDKYIADVGYHHTTSTGVAVQNSGGDSSNYIAELGYLPVPKIKVALMYEGFLKVKGKTDAADTSDYNTLTLGAWFMF